MKEVYSVQHLSEQYNGSGSGWIKISKASDEAVELSYSTDPMKITYVQNIECSNLSYQERVEPLMEDDNFFWMRCNFRCNQAYRF